MEHYNRSDPSLLSKSSFIYGFKMLSATLDITEIWYPETPSLCTWLLKLSPPVRSQNFFFFFLAALEALAIIPLLTSLVCADSYRSRHFFERGESAHIKLVKRGIILPVKRGEEIVLETLERSKQLVQSFCSVEIYEISYALSTSTSSFPRFS